MKDHTILIVDDEVDARDLLKIHLERHNNLKLLGEASNGVEALQLIESLKPDIILLDIQMPELNGMEVAARSAHDPLYIFITAYDAWAIKAFELNAVDYLLKPFTKTRFDQSIARALNDLDQRANHTDRYQFMQNDFYPNRKYVKRLAYKKDRRTILIPTHEIKMIEAADQYVMVYTAQSKHLVRQKMDYLEAVLNPHDFFRTHRSFIVKIDEIWAIENMGSKLTWVYLNSGQQVKLSQNRKELLQSLLSIDKK